MMMQSFVLTDRVLTEKHMQSIDRKEFTKYVKKYDLNRQKQTPKLPKSPFKALLEAQKNIFACTRSSTDSSATESCKKTKNLLSNLSVEPIVRNSQLKIPQTMHQSSLFKSGAFVANGIKKSMKELSETKKHKLRSCNLTNPKSCRNNPTPYDANYDLVFKKSPICVISPSSNRGRKTFDFITQIMQTKDGEGEQNISGKQSEPKHNIGKKTKKESKTVNIKQLIDKQFEDQKRRRRMMCRTAPTHSRSRKAQLNNSLGDNALLEQEISRAEMKIYTQMRQNKQNTQKRLQETENIFISKSKPLSKGEVNKSTSKILKKHNCTNIQYFSKFLNLD